MFAASVPFRTFLLAAVAAAGALLPRDAGAYSLAGEGPGGRKAAWFSLAGPAGEPLSAQLGSPFGGAARGGGRLPRHAGAEFAQESAAETAPEEPAAPAPFQRPEPAFGQYCRDTAVLTVAVFAWKRALNATAARRMFVDHYQSENFTTMPFINDGNNWTTNWVNHPLVGMWYYQYFRSFGHSRLASGFGSFFVSTVHEYLIETSFEPASGIDLLLTPGLGVPLGILTDEVSVDWARSDSRVKRFAAYVINPFLAMPWARWRRDARFDPRSDRFAFSLSLDF